MVHTRRIYSRPSLAERSSLERWRIAALLVPGLLLLACSGKAASAGVGGTAGAGGTPGAGGTASPGNGGSGTNTSGSGGGTNTSGSGGSGGTMGNSITDNPEFGFKVPCPPPPQPLILDFGGNPIVDAGGADAAAPAPVSDASFGMFGVTFAGGTYYYPADGPWPIASNVAQGNWHMTGDVGTYSGFGIYIVGCNVVDASTYDGISFTISGNVAMGNALGMEVATSANDVSHLWLNTVAVPPPDMPAAVNSGRCIPLGSSAYDGSCASPRASVPVTAQPTTVTVLWSQLTAGVPMASVDPTEITSISWTFPVPPGAGTTTPIPYPIDIVIDDISFVDNP